MDRFEIRLSGSGGQGMILAGIILAEAITYEGNYNVVQTQSYGPEARGGASKAEVIISREKVAYPKVTSPDILLTLTAEALIKYLPDLKKNGILIIDSQIDLEEIDLPVKTIRLPILKTAREELGREIVANMVALGSLVALVDFVGKEACLKAVKRRVPEGTEAINEMAFMLGYRQVEEMEQSFTE